jgi:hypothetical protein
LNRAQLELRETFDLSARRAGQVDQVNWNLSEQRLGALAFLRTVDKEIRLSAELVNAEPKSFRFGFDCRTEMIKWLLLVNACGGAPGGSDGSERRGAASPLPDAHAASATTVRGRLCVFSGNGTKWRTFPPPWQREELPLSGTTHEQK